MNDLQDAVRDALQDAADFARDAWRDAWLSMSLCAAAWTAVIVAGHADVTNEQAEVLTKIGWLLMLAHAPLQGALYRLALGGRAAGGLGPGGLQIGRLEMRLLGVNLLLAFALLWAAAPAVLISGLSYLLLRRFDGVTLGPLGHFEWWFLVAALFWAASLAAIAYFAGRLSLSSPITVEAERMSPFESWLLTAGRGGSALAAYTAAHLPALIALVAFLAFGLMEPAVAPVGLHGAWPLLDALGAGVVIGGLLAFIQAPMSVGVLTYLYDIWSPLPETAAVDPPAPANDPPAPANDTAIEEAVMAAEETPSEPHGPSDAEAPDGAKAEAEAEAEAKEEGEGAFCPIVREDEAGTAVHGDAPTPLDEPSASVAPPAAAEATALAAPEPGSAPALPEAAPPIEAHEIPQSAPADLKAAPTIAPEPTAFPGLSATDGAGRFAYETRPWQAGQPPPVFTPAEEAPPPPSGPIVISLPRAPAALDGAGEAEHPKP